MTNAEKYLKDGTDIGELAKEINSYISLWGSFDTRSFFEEQAEPTLTEDERVILKNIDETVFTHIGRDPRSSIYDLYLRGERTRCVEIDDILKPDLFTFIKERRRIFY